MSAELDALIHEAADWLRIPSISAGERNDDALRSAAEWAQRRVLAAGGTCELVDTPGGAPLVVGELRAAREDAPTVLIYGHYDVQDPGDESEWTTPPFEPDIRDGRLYARGAADDKGNFLPLLHVACEMADAGELPVHVRVLVEGAEESGTDDVNEWVLADERGADCAIVFDSGMLDAETPAITTATRGIVFAELEIRTGERIAHSGVYGGAALNAFHALHGALAAVLPGPDGRLPEPLRAGIEPPTARGAGGLGRAARAAPPSWPRPAHGLPTRRPRPSSTSAPGPAPSLDVHRIRGGEVRTIIPPVATCDLSVRLAPGQDPPEISAALEALLRSGLPDGRRADVLGGARQRVAVRPRERAAADRPRRARARVRPRAGADPHRRVAPRARRVLRARHPHDRVGLRAPAGRVPRARRVVRAHQPRSRPPLRPGALRGPGQLCGEGVAGHAGGGAPGRRPAGRLPRPHAATTGRATTPSWPRSSA